MELPVTQQRPILRYENGRLHSTIDTVASEYALTVYVDDEELATLVCTPSHLDELVVGFLAAEGVIRSDEEIVSLALDTAGGFAYVETAGKRRFSQRFFNKRYIPSCCGKGRQSFYFFNDVQTAKPVEQAPTLVPDDVLRLIGALQASSHVFADTGGVHNAALCTRAGIVAVRTDIGRHNALDKLYGYCLQHNVPRGDKLLAFSGRLSSEVILKAAKMGIGVVLSKSAPTELGLRIADELGITAIGFVRDTRFNVYTHPHRLQPGIDQPNE
ncbi:MAG: formate dehydrogenase accessory sulfurtransferase FdhD [Calditerricola sp.]|nr:formate dehydrogenase accessory sulfurtransferase FdhD [Calditerricola sp.]